MKINWVDPIDDDTQEDIFVDNNQHGQQTQHQDDEPTNDVPNNDEPTSPRKRKKRAKCWNYFEELFEIDDNGKKHYTGIARCLFCSVTYKADTGKNGTTNLNKHYPVCEENPTNQNSKKKQTILQFNKEANGEGSVSTWKYDDNRINKALLNLFIVGELPFKFVENEAFIEYTNALNGKFSLSSRHKISKDVAKYYMEERDKLFAYFSSPTNVVHLTTDTWTSSPQRVNYMVLTAHFIDDGWVMHKRIINFRPIHSHKGYDLGCELLECINGWGIKNVMTMTVDNAFSNDKAIEFLIKKLPNMYDGGKQFPIRCMAHILNLIVKDGFKAQNDHVECVQNAVRYIRQSTQRITRFKNAW